MAGILDTVDQRTQLVGENRLEILMFRLSGRQLFAINVFKVQEVLHLPKLTLIPQRNPVVCGVVNLRGQTLPVIDLSQAIGMRPLTPSDKSTIIVTEYNRSVQAFLVGGVDRILNLNWESILPPPGGAGRAHYLTAITKVDDQIVEIIDVEKVLSEIVPMSSKVSASKLEDPLLAKARGREVLLVDDSGVAMNQLRETMAQLDIRTHSAGDGLKALKLLKLWADSNADVPNKLLMVITDAEMPEMDGYRLTTEIRNDPRLQDLYVVLHTSLSGSFNEAMVKKVGCDDFLSKFQPDKLVDTVRKRLQMLEDQGKI
ncbi:two-component system chemotaxis response regulator CheV [Pseudomonas fluvialis]|uniref:Two-component system chemotaxis response regulator CheV n=1 Tax=Pseudomonas fluvialis TaxID=1793966 RepID=A0A7X0BR88_9PSED|nr:chemotaxis protein [Pseudomonas fluvialis]MBB6340943.1 two-component system chemotaxis response regulator CheV [Pseudomonas fluvialis]